MSRTAAALIASAIFLVGQTAWGAPSSVSVDAVFRSSDCKPTCDPDDGGLKQGSTVSGTIEIHVSATSDVVGLGFVRLEAQTGDDPFYYCIQRWEAQGARDFAASFDWNTRNWTGPDTPAWGCTESSPHWHGKATENGTYRLRVTASEAVNGEQASSPDFLIQVSNKRASAPSPSPSFSPSGSTAPSSEPAPSSSQALTPSPSEGSPHVLPGLADLRETAGAVAEPTAAVAAGPSRQGPDIARPIGLFLATVALGLSGSAVLRRLRLPAKPTA